MRIIKKIGKAILFFVLGILAQPFVFILLIILLVMCMGRIKYKIDAKVGEENSAYAEISYFMRLVKLVVSYAEGETKIRGRVAWVRIGEDKPKKMKKSRRKKSSKKMQVKRIASSMEDKDFASIGDAINYAKSEMKKNKDDAHDNKANDFTPVDSKGIAFTKRDSTESSQDTKSFKKESPEQEKDSPGFIALAKAILTYPDLKTIIGLAFQCLHKFVKALKPKKLDISGVVGFDDPATTGWFMGAYEAAAGVTGLRPHVRLLGSYHEKALRLDIHAHGRFRVIRLFTPFIWLYFKKPIRTLIHALLKKN